jgi:uncharacterized circularly permuted ATP-grasp superfamily protein
MRSRIARSSNRFSRKPSVFSELREQVLSHGDEGENPLAVILTPGPFNETYFEHAYLSRQLGVPLAEGTDLTVRDDTVYLKTLAGLKRVHTILRRLDDDFCDPLELRSDSTLGIPGLIGAVRANRVVMANALGTGVLESAAWLGFLPRIAQRLLGEKLSLPSVATWWCGEKPALDYVLTHLDKLVIKPTYPNQKFEPVFGRNLEGEKRRRLVQRLRARPRSARVCRNSGGNPHVCDCGPLGHQGHARRPRACSSGYCGRCCFHPARRRQQGHLGAA